MKLAGLAVVIIAVSIQTSSAQLNEVSIFENQISTKVTNKLKRHKA